MLQELSARLGKRKRPALLGLFALIILIAVGAAIWKNNAQKSVKKGNNQPIVSVELFTARQQPLEKQITMVGQTVADAQIDIMPKYAGRVVSVPVQLGDKVMAGQVLLVQDTGDITLSLAQNNADVRQAQATLVETQATYDANLQKGQADYDRTVTNYERYKTLYDKGGISRETLDSTYQTMINAKATLDTLINQSVNGEPASLEGKRAAAAKSVSAGEALEKQRADLILRAPRDGVIVYRQVEEGSFIQAAQKVLSLVDTSQVYVDCLVSEQEAAGLALGMTPGIEISSLGQTFAGKIIFISTAKESSSQSYKIRLSIDDPEHKLKSGLFARAQVLTQLRSAALLVPKSAILAKNGRSYVYIIGADKKAVEQEVKTGLGNDQFIEILAGLQPGVTVASTNVSKLKTGMVVTPTGQEDAPANTVAPQAGKGGAE